MNSDDAVRRAIHCIADGAPLSFGESRDAFAALMRGECSPVHTTALLFGLRARGESADELAGAAAALRDAMIRLRAAAPDDLVDTCGTGGGRVTTLNISTAAAFVVAGAGIRVAKHGNRSFTSRSGSADVLEALGIDIGLAPDRAAEVLERCGIVFLFAPTYHPAMRHAGPVRRELGAPTIMNLLGPLVNPAGAGRQVVGVADVRRAPLVAAALATLGAAHAVVVHAEIGMDEVSPSGDTAVWEVSGGEVRRWSIVPGEYGLAVADIGSLAGGEPPENALRMEAIFRGKGTEAERAAVTLNAAAAIYVSAAAAGGFDAAVRRAADSLASGAAHTALTRLRDAAPAA